MIAMKRIPSIAFFDKVKENLKKDVLFAFVAL